MLTNEAMKPSRWLHRYTAKNTVERIKAHLKSGGTVTLTTYLNHTEYRKPAHADLFSYSGSSMYVARGKRKDCINGCSIRFWR